MNIFELDDGFRVQESLRVFGIMSRYPAREVQKTAERIKQCAMSQMAFYDPNDPEQRPIFRSSRCRSKLCTFCESLRAFHLQQNLMRVFENKKNRFFFLTLTFPQNCAVFALRQDVKNILKNCSKFFRKAPFKFMLGSGRFVEFTISDAGLFHVHVHCVFEMPDVDLWDSSPVRKLYFSKDHQRLLAKYFCSQKKMKIFENFQQKQIDSLSNGYFPPTFISYLAMSCGFGQICDIREKKDRLEKEVAKYVTKPWEFKDPDLLMQVYWEIKCCRFYSLTGTFKKVDVEREKIDLVFMGTVKNLCASALNNPLDSRKQQVLRLADKLGVVKVNGIGGRDQDFLNNDSRIVVV